MIRVVPRADPVITEAEEASFRALVQGAFGLRRKQLRRVVRTLWALDATAADAVLARAGLDGDRRPETLAPAEFARLLRSR